MENKINIAELLKDCPTGMELDCTMFNNVTFVRVDNNRIQFPIEIAVGGLRSKYLTKDGCFHDNTFIPEAKCVIFPKGKTTWEGFVPPCQFKEGDAVVAEYGESFQLFLLKHLIRSENANTHDGDCYFGWDFQCNALFEKGEWGFNRLATEEEKQKLFDAIKANGYEWNAETKTLEKLVEPRFKVGDRIKYKNGKNKDGVKEGIILSITDDTYDVAVTNDMGIFIPVTDQDNYELAPNKFDITTLKPFDKVLVRDDGTGKQRWTVDYFSFVNKELMYPFICVGHYVNQCIPYKNNEHLLGTYDDCDEYYKTWEK